MYVKEILCEGGDWTHLSVENFCKQIPELQISTNGGEFLHQLSGEVPQQNGICSIKLRARSERTYKKSKFGVPIPDPPRTIQYYYTSQHRSQYRITAQVKPDVCGLFTQQWNGLSLRYIYCI